MATRGKRSRKPAPARKVRRPAPRKNTNRRKAAMQTKGARAKSAAHAAPRRQRASTGAEKSVRAIARTPERRAAAQALRPLRPIVRMASGWSTLRVVWRPAIAMATLPYRVYRVYRWAEAESHRSGAAVPPALA